MIDKRNINVSDRTTTVVWAVTLLVGCALTALPATALQADDGATSATPNTPGDTAEYRITVVAERGDAITENGLKHVLIDFGADPDFTGNATNVTARDVTVRVEDGATNRTRSVGPISVVPDARTELLLTLDSPDTQVEPGDRIVVRVEGVTNSAIAIDNPEGPRGFALGVGVADTEGNLDGPVEVRYALDPTARAAATATTTTTAQPALTTTAPSTPETTTTTTTTTATRTAARTTRSATSTGGSGASGDVSETVGPAPALDSIPATELGVGIAVALLALLASALVTTRYQ